MDVLPNKQGYMLLKEDAYTCPQGTGAVLVGHASRCHQQTDEQYIDRDINTMVCHTYCPQGKYIGTIRWDRAEWLHEQYMNFNPSGTYTEFKRELAMLVHREMLRYKPSTSSDKGRGCCWQWDMSAKPFLNAVATAVQHWSGDELLDVHTIDMAVMPKQTVSLACPTRLALFNDRGWG